MCSSVLLGGFNVKQTSLSIFNLLAQIQPKGLRPAPFPEQAGFTFLMPAERAIRGRYSTALGSHLLEECGLK